MHGEVPSLEANPGAFGRAPFAAMDIRAGRWATHLEDLDSTLTNALPHSWRRAELAWRTHRRSLEQYEQTERLT